MDILSITCFGIETMQTKIQVEYCDCFVMNQQPDQHYKSYLSGGVLPNIYFIKDISVIGLTLCSL